VTNRVRAALMLACVVSAAVELRGQAVFRTAVDVVEVDVAVMRGGRSVGGLTAANFVVTDNGIEQDVTAVMVSAEPVRLALVLDVSESVAGSRLASLIKASRGLIRALRARDEVSLITFSHRVTAVVPMGQDHAAVDASLATLTGDGATSLRDAAYLGLATSPGQQSRALMLLFSDGLDTASFLTESAVLAAARRSNTVVHAVRARPDNFLERLVEVTGGRTWSAGSDRQLEELFGRVLDEMRARYVLSYSPSGRQTPGWHQIKVSLKGARGDVRARQGYYVE
jgi:VWFA-related protein